MRDNGGYQRFGQVVERRPQQYDIVHAAGEVQGLVKKALDIVDGLVILIHSGLPLAFTGLGDEVGEKYAVAQASKVIDISGRCGSGIDDAETRLSLQTRAHRRPSARMACNPGAACGGRRLTTFLAFIEPTANHSGTLEKKARATVHSLEQFRKSCKVAKMIVDRRAPAHRRSCGWGIAGA